MELAANLQTHQMALAEQESIEIMNTNLGKILGIILSALWLFVAGYFALLGFFFAEDAPRSQWLQIRSYYVLNYIAFGVGPVLCFILVKRRYGPLSYTALIFLASLAAFPLLLFLLYLVLKSN